MDKRTTAVFGLIVLSTQLAFALTQQSESKPLHLQKVEIQLDGLKDCQPGKEEIRNLNLKPEEMCLVEVRGFENRKGILLESKVAGRELPPYFGNRDTFDGNVTYIKKDLPQN